MAVHGFTLRNILPICFPVLTKIHYKNLHSFAIFCEPMCQRVLCQFQNSNMIGQDMKALTSVSHCLLNGLISSWLVLSVIQ